MTLKPTPLFFMLSYAGITDKQLADMVGCTHSYIGKVKNGINIPSPAVAEAIVKALIRMKFKTYNRKPISELMFFYPGRY